MDYSMVKLVSIALIFLVLGYLVAKLSSNSQVYTLEQIVDTCPEFVEHSDTFHNPSQRIPVDTSSDTECKTVGSSSDTKEYADNELIKKLVRNRNITPEELSILNHLIQIELLKQKILQFIDLLQSYRH